MLLKDNWCIAYVPFLTFNAWNTDAMAGAFPGILDNIRNMRQKKERSQFLVLLELSKILVQP